MCGGMFLTCDYREDPKHPPTKFTVRGQNYDDVVLEVSVSDYKDLESAWHGLWDKLNEMDVEGIMASSVIDYLFMDGLLKK